MFEHLNLDRSLQLGLDALAFTEPTDVQRGDDTRSPSPARTCAYQLKPAAARPWPIIVPVAQRILGRDSRTRRRHAGPDPRSHPGAGPTGAQALPAVTGQITTGRTGHHRWRRFQVPEIPAAQEPGNPHRHPGRLLEHCEKGSADLRSLQTLVLDEADRMLDMGFREDVLKIAGYCSPQRQVLMLSATLQHKGLGGVARELLQRPQGSRHWAGAPAPQQHFSPAHPGRRPGAQRQAADSAAAGRAAIEGRWFSANKRITREAPGRPAATTTNCAATACTAK